MSQTLHHEAFFRRPRAEVFEFITTTGHWPKWHPATQAVTGQTLKPGQPGDESEEKVLTAGYFPGHVRWRVVSSVPPESWSIVTTEIDLPLLSGANVRLEYQLREEGRGTRLLRTFCYELPWHLWLFDKLYFRAKMESESVEGLRRLTALVDAALAEAA
ncbi:MAG: SRPBCC family protein [Deltaproteobacteria bacterium]|nr:SRPBCC family protein [Deltaproteobacteria bacterium]